MQSRLRSIIYLSMTVLLAVGVAITLAADRDGKAPIPREAVPVPPARPVPLNHALHDEAKHEILAEMQAPDGFIRAHAIEAAQKVMPDEAMPGIVAALSDSQPVTRFAAAMAIGELRCADAKEAILKKVDDNDPSVRVAVRFALHRLGDTRFSHDFEKFAHDPNPGVRGNTAIALGRLGEPTAVRVLRPMEEDTNPAVRLQVAEALWRMGDEDGLKSLVGACLSAYSDDQIIAYEALAGPRMINVRAHIRAGLTSDYIEVALSAARALGELDSDEGYGVALIGIKSADPRVRSLAALALGAIGRSDAQGVLRPLLHDKDSADVRLSAALAILQLKEGK